MARSGKATISPAVARDLDVAKDYIKSSYFNFIFNYESVLPLLLLSAIVGLLLTKDTLSLIFAILILCTTTSLIWLGLIRKKRSLNALSLTSEQVDDRLTVRLIDGFCYFLSFICIAALVILDFLLVFFALLNFFTQMFFGIS